MKRIITLIVLIAFGLILTSFNESIDISETTVDEYSLLQELGYSAADQETLYSRFSPVEIEHIIDFHITKDKLFPYLQHPYFNLGRFEDYESNRDRYALPHFASVNYTHTPISLLFDSNSSYIEMPAPLKNTTLVLVNKQFYLAPEDVPENLIFIGDLNLVVPGPLERNYMKQEAYDALKRFFQEAERHGHTLFVLSAYRSFMRQQNIYEELLLEDERNIMLSAKPGHSEHQTGLSVDITSPSVDYRLIPDFEHTPEGQFILNNAHKFGFIIRYPKNKEHITGYHYEPWHLRYVGIEVATFINQSGLTLEEFILYHVPLPDIDTIEKR